MSAPTHEQSIFEDLDTTDTIILSRVLTTDVIIADLERQFGSDTTHSIIDKAIAHLHAKIDEEYPDALETNRRMADQMARSGKLKPGNYEHTESTMHGDAADVAAEPDIAYELQSFSPAEDVVVLAALRKAATMAGSRQHATDILAHHSPSKLERGRRKAATAVGRLYMSAHHIGPYKGRHRPK